MSVSIHPTNPLQTQSPSPILPLEAPLTKQAEDVVTKIGIGNLFASKDSSIEIQHQSMSSLQGKTLTTSPGLSVQMFGMQFKALGVKATFLALNLQPAEAQAGVHHSTFTLENAVPKRPSPWVVVAIGGMMVAGSVLCWYLNHGKGE